MKRKVTALLTALLLTLTLCVPALAWTEYGAIYDETDALGSDELSNLGQYTLPQLTEALHLDLRVDIFTNEDVSEGTTAGDIATYVYKRFRLRLGRGKGRHLADAGDGASGGRFLHPGGDRLVRLRDAERDAGRRAGTLRLGV